MNIIDVVGEATKITEQDAAAKYDLPTMSESSFQRHLDAMRDADYIAVDTETTGLLVKDGRDYLTGISVAYRLGPLGIMSAYFPFRHPSNNLTPLHAQQLGQVLCSKPLIFHNLKFDLFSLATININPTGVGSNKLFDTCNIAHMLQEFLLSHQLDYLGKKFLKMGKDKDEVKRWADTYGWATVPAGLMAPYAEKDAELALLLFEYLWPKLREEELHSLWPEAQRFTRLLRDIEARGVRVDLEFAQVMANRGEDRMKAIMDELDDMFTDITVDKLGPKVLYKLLIEELGLPVLGWTQLDKQGNKTEKSKPSWTKDIMNEYDEILAARNSDVAKLVLEYRGWQKATSSLYLSVLKFVSPDGRVRPNFKQHGTVTSRLSCSEPNLQQIPRKSDKPWNGQAKRCFVAADGYELWGYDYAQLEFRLAASYGQVHWLLEEFNNPDGDVFTAMMSQIGAPRQDCKTYTYATIYGASKNKIALTMGRSVDEITPTYDAFAQTIAGIKQVSEQATKVARQRGYVRYWSGRRRHFPYGDGAHKAFNSLLQGGGAEVVKRAMIRIDDDPRIDKDKCRIVLQVHDEIVFEVMPEYRKKVEPIIIEHMTNFPDFGVTFSVEGKNWTTGETDAQIP